MRRDFPCWRTWRIWWRAARSRPTGRRRSAAFIGWRGLERLLIGLLGLLDLLGCFLRLEIVDGVVDRLGQRGHARRIGAEIVPPVARGRADVDPRAVGIGADTQHHVIAKTEDRRAGDRLDAAVAAPLL